MDKTERIGLSKADALTEEEISEKREILSKLGDSRVFVFSAVSGQGIKDVVRALADLVARRVVKEKKEAEAANISGATGDADDTVAAREEWSPLGEPR